MRTLCSVLLCVAMALIGAGCGEGPLVMQGRVVSFDAQAKVVRLADEARPGTEVEFSLATADIGAVPAVGDELRIAYRVREGRNVAGRVMNLTKQAKLLGSGGGH